VAIGGTHMMMIIVVVGIIALIGIIAVLKNRG
jgi:hypothetical protein